MILPSGSQAGIRLPLGLLSLSLRLDLPPPSPTSIGPLLPLSLDHQLFEPVEGFQEYP